MSDPRLVEPQRVAASGETCEHRYWCAKRITGAVLLGAVLAALAAAAVWWLW